MSIFAWRLAHALVFALTACGGAHRNVGAAPADGRPAVEQRTSAAEAGWVPAGHVGTAECPADALAIETESDPKYALQVGDHLPALGNPLRRGTGEQQVAESLGTYPESGQPSFPLLAGAVRLAVEEGRDDSRHVVALREAASGYCVLGVWTTEVGEGVSQIAARAHWLAPDRSWMLVLVETISVARGYRVDDDHDEPADEQRGWAVLGTDGMRLWVAGVDQLDRFLKPAFRAVDGDVHVVDLDTSPYREARRLRVDVDGQLVFGER